LRPAGRDDPVHGHQAVQDRRAGGQPAGQRDEDLFGHQRRRTAGTAQLFQERPALRADHAHPVL
ncbi:hypothetical protein LTR94_033875, partial [Friedmanniomyces endolithicus]